MALPRGATGIDGRRSYVHPGVAPGWVSLPRSVLPTALWAAPSVDMEHFQGVALFDAFYGRVRWSLAGATWFCLCCAKRQ